MLSTAGSIFLESFQLAICIHYFIFGKHFTVPDVWKSNHTLAIKFPRGDFFVICFFLADVRQITRGIHYTYVKCQFSHARLKSSVFIKNRSYWCNLFFSFKLQYLTTFVLVFDTLICSSNVCTMHVLQFRVRPPCLTPSLSFGGFLQRSGFRGTETSPLTVDFWG